MMLIRLMVGFLRAGLFEARLLLLGRLLFSLNLKWYGLFWRGGAPDPGQRCVLCGGTHQWLTCFARQRSGLRQPKPNWTLVLPSMPSKRRGSKALFYHLLQRRASTSFTPVAKGGRGMAYRQSDVMADHYVVERLLYVGAMSELYLVKDNRADRAGGRLMVAKVAHTRRHEAHEVLAAFEREIELMKEFEHPNLLRCEASGVVAMDGEAQPMPYLIMPYVKGCDLKRVLSRQRAGKSHSSGLPLADVLAIFDELLPALECLHDEGLVHCDIKPENVLLGDDGRVFLIDLGNATPISKYPAYRNPTYSAPETGLRQVVNEASDIYSLGKLLFELVTGQNPEMREAQLRPQLAGIDAPVAESKAAKAERAESGAVASLVGSYRSLLGHDDGRHLAYIISKATSWASIDRYPDVEALREALNYLSNEFATSIY